MGFQTQLEIVKDINGVPTYGLSFTNVNYQTQLEADVDQSLTVPNTATNWLAIFSFEPGSSVWVAQNESAEAPSGSFAATNSQLNPNARFVKAGNVLNFITSNTTAQVGVSLYAIGQ